MKLRLSVALALITRGDEILITQRLSTADHLPNFWEFPGGKVEDGETPVEAAIREAREEVGLTVELVRLLGVVEWEYPKRIVTLQPFEVRVVAGEMQLNGVADARWVAIRDLDPTIFPEANRGMIEQLQGFPQ